jgi:hypothetical protein
MIDGISSLIQAAPMTLSMKNAEHQLYPFMLAAITGDVNLTLELLLANPTMVNVGHHPTTEPPEKKARLS